MSILFIFNRQFELNTVQSKSIIISNGIENMKTFTKNRRYPFYDSKIKQTIGLIPSFSVDDNGVISLNLFTVDGVFYDCASIVSSCAAWNSVLIHYRYEIFVRDNKIAKFSYRFDIVDGQRCFYFYVTDNDVLQYINQLSSEKMGDPGDAF